MPLTSKRAYVWLTVGLVAAATACGDETSRADFPVESGIARRRPLTELAPAEMTALCETALATTVTFLQSDETMSYACTLAASLLSITADDSSSVHVDEQSCRDARKECLKLPDPEPTEPPGCAAFKIDLPATCQATVGEYEECVERLLTALDDDWRSISCSSLAKIPLQEWPAAHVTGPRQVEGCARIAQDCTSLPWPSVKGAYGRANERSEAVRRERATVAGSGTP